MAYKKIRTDVYVCDTAEDLARIPERDMNSVCYVIEEACEYRLNSKGKWIKQVSAAFGNVDLSGYATEGFVAEAVAAIKVPDTSKLATKTEVKAVEKKIPSLDGYAKSAEIEAVKANPVLGFFNMSRNPAKHDAQSIYLNASDGSLVDAMKAKGLSISNVWIEKGHPSLPQIMLDANTSGRGIAVVDFQQDGDTIGYVILFDKQNNMYYQFLNHNVAGPWMKVATEQV